MPSIQKRKKECHHLFWVTSFKLPKKKNENTESWVMDISKEKKNILIYKYHGCLFIMVILNAYIIVPKQFQHYFFFVEFLK